MESGWTHFAAMMFVASKPPEWVFTDMDRLLLYTNDRVRESAKV
jgi:hypothetical protein